MPADYISNSSIGVMDLAQALGLGYVVAMPPAMPRRTDVGERIWQAMKAKGDSLATLARAFKAKGLPIKSVGGLRYMMEQADRYDERVMTALSERYGHSRSYWITGIEGVAPVERSVDRLGAYITGTFMEEVRQTVRAEAMRLASEQMTAVFDRFRQEAPDLAAQALPILQRIVVEPEAAPATGRVVPVHPVPIVDSTLAEQAS